MHEVDALEVLQEEIFRFKQKLPAAPEEDNDQNQEYSLHETFLCVNNDIYYICLHAHELNAKSGTTEKRAYD